MGFNIHILSGRNRSTNLPGHAALAASFNPTRFKLAAARSRRSPREGPESAPYASFRCEREVGFTAGSMHLSEPQQSLARGGLQSLREWHARCDKANYRVSKGIDRAA